VNFDLASGLFFFFAENYFNKLYHSDLTPEDESTSDETLTNCQSLIKLSLGAEPTTVEPAAKISVENVVNYCILKIIEQTVRYFKLLFLH
jgi:hypothetical protein